MSEKASPFDFVESISKTKEDLIASGREEREYNAYLTNRALSMFPDCVLYVNEMNYWRDLPGKLQYDYLRGTVRAKSRRSGKWPKKEEEALLEMVCLRYGISPRTARQMLPLLSADHAKELLRIKESVIDAR